MGRPKFYRFLTGLLVGGGLAFPALAQVSGVNLINVPAANIAISSQNDLILEFQVTGSASAQDILQVIAVSNSNGSAQAPYDLSNGLNVWFQTASGPFSPALATAVGPITAIDHFDWSNGPPYSTPPLNSPVTVGGGYYFVTADVVAGALAGNLVKASMAANSVSFSTAGLISNGNQINSTTQSIVADGTPSFTLLNIPGGSVLPGTNDYPVFGTQIQVTGAVPLTQVDIFTTGTPSGSDFGTVKLWDEPNSAGPNFNPTQASYVTPLTIVGGNHWQNTTSNWNVQNNDYLFITANIAPSAVTGDVFQFQAQPTNFQFTTINLPGTVSSNSAPSTILAPTPTSTFTPTVTSTNSPTSTPTPIITIPPTLTLTLPLTLTPMLTVTNTPTVSRTPTPAPTLTFTATHTPVAVTSPGTASPAPPSPTPNVPLYLDANFFNPRQQNLGMDVRVDQAGVVKLRVYNLAGELVRKIAEQTENPGNYRFYWNGLNDAGGQVGNALYFIVVETPSSKLIRKVIVLK